MGLTGQGMLLDSCMVCGCTYGKLHFLVGYCTFRCAFVQFDLFRTFIGHFHFLLNYTDAIALTASSGLVSVALPLLIDPALRLFAIGPASQHLDYNIRMFSLPNTPYGRSLDAGVSITSAT